MSNPSGPDQGNEPAAEPADETADAPTPTTARHRAHADTQQAPAVVEDIRPRSCRRSRPAPPIPTRRREDRRATLHRTVGDGLVDDEIIEPPPEPATEVFSTPTEPIAAANPLRHSSFRAASDAPKPPAAADAAGAGWSALILVIAALVAVAILGTVLLTRDVRLEGVAGGPGPHDDPELRRRRSRRATWPPCAASPAARPRDSYVNYDDRAVDRHPRQGGRGQAVPGGGQHRPGRRQRRPRRGQRHDVHGVRSADPLDAQLRPAVPRRAVEDLPGARS